MDSIDAGILSLLPPLIAIGLALYTKEVISSLIVGILSGTLIYSISTTDGVFDITAKTFETTTSLMAGKIGDNASIIIFLALLGSLVAVITRAGGSRAYGQWAGKKVKSPRGAKLATSALGSLIFIDDYFNCLTVGTVMKPVTDEHRISRAKLSYLIDGTAAPICIIAPVSSWAAFVISQMNDSGLDGMSDFVKTIPLNFYALLSIALVLILSFTNLDFGKMKRCEENARTKITSQNDNNTMDEDSELARLQISDKGKVFDLVVPIAVLILTSVIAMLYTGGYFNGGITMAQAFGQTDAGSSLAISGFISLLVAMLMLVPRKILSFKDFMSSIGVGVRSMVPVYIILTLAWTISSVCKDLLGTGIYVGDLVKQSDIPPAILPFIIFIIAGFLSFSMGTSWGTFGIFIPIVTTICQSVAPELTIIAIAATLSGAVFGDHCSPISDTTILSSTGAGCELMEHVSSQMAYALLAAGCSAIGFLVAGITQSTTISLSVSAGLLILSLVIIKLFQNKKKI